MVCETLEVVELIKLEMKVTRDKHKSYPNSKRGFMQFQVGDLVYVKRVLLEGVIRFGLKGKMKPRHLGPYPIIEMIILVAYRVQMHEHGSSS